MPEEEAEGKVVAVNLGKLVPESETTVQSGISTFVSLTAIYPAMLCPKHNLFLNLATCFSCLNLTRPQVHSGKNVWLQFNRSTR